MSFASILGYVLSFTCVKSLKMIFILSFRSLEVKRRLLFYRTRLEVKRPLLLSLYIPLGSRRKRVQCTILQRNQPQASMVKR